MTRFDYFIRHLILQKLHLSLTQLNERQMLLLDSMVKEVYQNKQLHQLDVEQKVNHIVSKHQVDFFVF